jgi:hypothetical protein
LHEILPVRRRKHHSQASLGIAYVFVAELASADAAQQPMQLVDREHGCGRIVYRLRKGFGGDVDNHPEGEGWILLDGPLTPERDGTAKVVVGDGSGAAVEEEQRLALRHKITDARGEFDDAVRTLRLNR